MARSCAKGYGWANREKQRPITRETLFNIGSISKTHAACGLLKLVEEGKLDLDAPVEKYPPDGTFHSPRSTMMASPSVASLSHTAGLRLHGFPGFDPSEKLPTIEESLSGKTNGSGDVQVIMEPGSKWQYSGGGVEAIDRAAALWRVPRSGGPAAKVVDGVLQANYAVRGGGVYYIDQPAGQAGTHYVDQPAGETRLRYFDFATRRATTIAPNLGSVDLPIAVSPDGRTILYARLDATTNDLMLVSPFR